MLDMDVLNLYDETTASIREVVPVEQVYSLLDTQKKEMTASMKELMQEKLRLCDEISKKITDDMRKLKENVINDELVKTIEEE